MSVLPLTKTLALEDLDALALELALVDQQDLSTQHPLRRWEYALALRAWSTWRYQPHQGQPALRTWQVLDVGGAGSPFAAMLLPLGLVICVKVDPLVNVGIESFQVAPNSQDAIFSISTIEHVEHPRAFLKAIARALAPGGLLFLTFDCWNCEGADVAHFHWMRARIYNPKTWRELAAECRDLGFDRFGGVDWAFRGDHLYGSYTFASLCLTKGVR